LGELTRHHPRVTAAPLIDRLLAPFHEFASSRAASGILLIVAAVIALLWANSPIASSYVSFWETRLSIGVDEMVLPKSLLHWINDGLMAVFFLVVGLEIKREVLVGELASVRRAALPIAAALGGALVPALVFLLIVGPGEGARGWAVPIATDIALCPRRACPRGRPDSDRTPRLHGRLGHRGRPSGCVDHRASSTHPMSP